MAVEEDLPNWVVGVVEGHLQYQVVVDKASLYMRISLFAEALERKQITLFIILGVMAVMILVTH